MYTFDLHFSQIHTQLKQRCGKSRLHKAEGEELCGNIYETAQENVIKSTVWNALQM